MGDSRQVDGLSLCRLSPARARTDGPGRLPSTGADRELRRPVDTQPDDRPPAPLVDHRQHVVVSPPRRSAARSRPRPVLANSWTTAPVRVEERHRPLAEPVEVGVGAEHPGRRPARSCVSVWSQVSHRGLRRGRRRRRCRSRGRRPRSAPISRPSVVARPRPGCSAPPSGADCPVRVDEVDLRGLLAVEVGGAAVRRRRRRPGQFSPPSDRPRSRPPAGTSGRLQGRAVRSASTVVRQVAR